jgi:hypothetical protein
LESGLILLTKNEQRRRECCLFSIDVQFPKLEVAGSIPVSRFSNQILQPNHMPNFQTISIRFPLDVEPSSQLDVSAGSRPHAARVDVECLWRYDEQDCGLNRVRVGSNRAHAGPGANRARSIGYGKPLPMNRSG